MTFFRLAFLLFFLTSTSFHFSARAQDLDQDAEQALLETQKLLKDAAQRSEAIKKSADAMKVDQSIQSLTQGSEKSSQEIYSISADVFAMIVASAQGDPEKLQKILDKAQKDPKAFFESLSPELKNRVRAVAGEIQMKDVGSNRK